MKFKYIHTTFLRLLAIVALFVSAASCQDKPQTTSASEVGKKIDTMAFQHADSLHDHAKNLWNNRKFQEAHDLFLVTDSLFLKQERYTALLLSNMNHATALRSLYVPQDSILNTIAKSLQYLDKLPPDNFEVGLLYSDYGASLTRAGSHDNALYYAQKGQEILILPKHKERKLRDFYVARNYKLLSAIEDSKYNYKEAINYVKERIAFQEERNLEKIDSYVEWFELLSLSNDSIGAVELLNTYPYEEKLKNAGFFDKYHFYLSRMDFYKSQGAYDEALESYQPLKDLIEGSSMKAHFTDWFFNQRIGDIYLAKGEYQNVIDLISGQEILPAYEKARYMVRARDLLTVSIAHKKMGQIDEAKTAIQKALDYYLPEGERNKEFLEKITFKNVAYKVRLTNILYFKGELLMDLYDKNLDAEYFDAALFYFNQAHELLKQVGLQSKEDQFINDLEFNGFYESLFDAHYEAWSKAPSEDLFYKVLRICDESKSIAVLDELRQIKKDKLFENIPLDIRNRESYFVEVLDSLSNKYRAGQNKDVAEDIDVIVNQFNSFKTKLSMEHPKYFQLNYGTSNSLKEILGTQFKENEILEYFVGDNLIFIFGWNAGQTVFDRVAYTPQLKQAITATIASVKNPQNQAFMANSNIVYKALFEPYINGEKPLAVVLDGTLNSLPVESLVMNLENSSSFLNTSTSVVRLTGLLNSLTSGISEKKSALIYAPFTANQSAGKTMLPSSLLEAKGVNKIYGGSLKTGANANKASFLLDANKYGIIHLATHSEINKNAPLKSTIYFSEDSTKTPDEQRLKIEELYNLKLNSSLVTLSSCETGLGKEVKGKGIQSISNAFSYAGVESTVMSLWKVPDKQTAQIMLLFYQHLDSGNLKDKALQMAKNDYLEQTSDVHLTHPYYWAGFVISGDTSPIANSTPVVKYVAFGALLLGLIGFGIFIRRRKAA